MTTGFRTGIAGLIVALATGTGALAQDLTLKLGHLAQ